MPILAKCAVFLAVVSAPAQEVRRDMAPDRALWLDVKRALTDKNGSDYFEHNFKGALVPGGVNGALMFKATVVSAKWDATPPELVVAIADTKTPEITLQVNDPSHKASAAQRKIKAGDSVWFQGSPRAFTQEPFMVTFDVQFEDVRLEAPKQGMKREIPLPKP